MKNLISTIKEASNNYLIDKNKDSYNATPIEGYYGIPMKNGWKEPWETALKTGSKISADIKYALIFPVGGTYLFTEDGLNQLIEEMNFIAGDPDHDPYGEVADNVATYEELRDIKKVKEWTTLSGPTGNGALKDTIGIRFF